MFSGVCFLGLLWLGFSLPETSGKSLEEIGNLFVRPGEASINGYQECAQEGDLVAEDEREHN